MIYKRESKEYLEKGKAICNITHYLFNKPIYQDIRYTTNVNVREGLGEGKNTNKTSIKGFTND